MARPQSGDKVPNSLDVDQFLSNMRVAASAVHRKEGLANCELSHVPLNPVGNSDAPNFVPSTPFQFQQERPQTPVRQTTHGTLTAPQPGHGLCPPNPNGQHYRPGLSVPPHRQSFHEPPRMAVIFSRPPPPRGWNFRPPGITRTPQPVSQYRPNTGNFSAAGGGPNPGDPRPPFQTFNFNPRGGETIQATIQRHQLTPRLSTPMAHGRPPQPQGFGVPVRPNAPTHHSGHGTSSGGQDSNARPAKSVEENFTKPEPEQNPQRRLDQEWVDRWLQELNKHKQVTTRKTVVTIANYKCCVQEALKLKGELAGLTAELQSHLESDEWQQKFDQINKIRIRLETLNQILTDEVTLENIKRLCNNRKKKRERLKRRKQALFEERQAELDRREQLHTTIDAVQDRLLQKSLQEKQDKDMKATADKILGEVRRKLTETDKTMEMITALRKLRQLRCQSVYTKGMYLGMESDTRFETQTDELLLLLENQKKIYETEEKTLKVMLETEQEETKEREREEKRRLQADKERRDQRLTLQRLFGKDDKLSQDDPLLLYKQFYRQAESNLETLVAVRQSWDIYLVPEPVPGSSPIPMQWVWPPQPSNETWASVLKQ